MVGREVSFGDQKVYLPGLGRSVEAALHPLGCFQLQHGWRQIRERSAFCFGIVRYGGSQ